SRGEGQHAPEFLRRDARRHLDGRRQKSPQAGQVVAGDPYPGGVARGIDARKAGLCADPTVELAGRDSPPASWHRRLGWEVRDAGALGARPFMIFTETPLRGAYLVDMNRAE